MRQVRTSSSAATALAFEANMALDSLRNEYLLHSQLYQCFISRAGISSVKSLNARVYDQLFLTPDRDPWLGLVSPDSFLEIKGHGIR
jgi:hypothetical protein